MGDGSVENPIVLDEEEDKKMLLLHQHPSLSDPRNLPGCREVALLEQNWKMYTIINLKNCFIRYYRAGVLIKIIINMFHFIIKFFQKLV